MRRVLCAASVAALSTTSAVARAADSAETLDQRARSLLTEIRSTDARRHELATAFERAGDAHEEAATRLARAEVRLATGERDLEAARRDLGARARDAWRMRSADALGGLVGSAGWSAAARRDTHLARIAAAETARTRDNAGTVMRHAALARALDEERAALADREQALAALAAEAAAEGERKRTLLEEVLDEHERLARIERAARREVDAAAERTTGTSAPDQPDSLDGRRGSLPRPVAGDMVEAFGAHRDPTYSTVTHSNGVAIRAPRSAPVHAIADGRVAFRGYVDGFGHLVILEHGGGFLSVYGHLESADDREPGTHVAEGDRVGRVGSSGLADEPRLYFELRRGQEPLDPQRWWGPPEGLARDDQR